MSEFECACGGPDCAVNGCKRLRELQQTRYQQMPPAPGAFVAKPITEQDVRRIIREELERAADAPLAEAVEWETIDGLYRTTDKAKAMNWEPNVGVRVVRRAKATGQADQGSER